VEWIAAHRLQPHWLRPCATGERLAVSVSRGICPYAGAVIDAAQSEIEASALALTTICDQMRYAAATIDRAGRYPVFLMNVPSTWQTEAAKNLYLDELRRFGRFLEKQGGTPPGDAELSRVMLEFDRARFAQDTPADLSSIPSKIPLAIVGGPMLKEDFDFFDLVESAGGRLVFDATEGGQRTQPRRFDPSKVADDPLQELADAYFNSIPDAFRRPNSGLYEWLGRELNRRHVRGIVFRRYVWCDLWHGELQRLKQWSPVPVLDIDEGQDDLAAPNRLQGRLEAFLEMLDER
jgi:benzoyl-CoA reductase/2-hydroxyglutaryl-CoA dehydratase subunit BcrC/BadD/HgdB